MSKPADQIPTHLDLFDIPDTLVGEIRGGVLITHPRPSPIHSLAASALGATLFNGSRISDASSGWWILDQPECHLSSDVVVQDIAGWRKSKMAKLPDTAWFDLPPDWVCEVISPATAKYDRSIKRDIYARENIGYYWIVDPVERLIEAFVLKNGSWTLHTTVADNQIVELPPFEDLPFELSVLWE